MLYKQRYIPKWQCYIPMLYTMLYSKGGIYVKSIILWYQVPHLRVALSDSGRSPHRRCAGREAHGRSGLSSRPWYGWLPTRASSEFVNEPPSRVRRGRRSPVLQTCSLTGHDAS